MMKNNNPQKNIPIGWQEVMLSDIGIFSKGAGITKDQLVENGNNAVRYGELYTRHNFHIKKVYSHIPSSVIPTTKKIKYGDILFAGSGETIDEIGKSAAYLLNEDCYAGGDVIVLTPKKADSLFLSYFLNTGEARKKLRELGQGQSVVHIYKKDIEKLKLHLPLLAEQKRVVSIIAIWDQTIEKLAKKIKIKKNIKKGLMQNLLTGAVRLAGFNDEWKITKIGDIGEVVSGGTPDTTEKSYWGGDIQWITPTEITKLKGKYIYSTGRTISELGLKNSSATIIPKKSLIVCSRATVGDCAINLVDITTNQGFKNIIPKKIQIDLLYYWMLTKKHYLKRIASGSTFLEFSKKDLEKIKISIPNDVKEQKAIADILNTSDKEIEALEKKLSILKDQKKYLLNNLITGSIRTKA